MAIAQDLNNIPSDVDVEVAVKDLTERMSNEDISGQDLNLLNILLSQWDNAKVRMKFDGKLSEAQARSYKKITN